VRTLVAGAAPVLVDATAATGLPLTFEVTATAVTAFALPELPARVPALTTAP
jgi:hypothetical protein